MHHWGQSAPTHTPVSVPKMPAAGPLSPPGPPCTLLSTHPKTWRGGEQGGERRLRATLSSLGWLQAPAPPPPPHLAAVHLQCAQPWSPSPAPLTCTALLLHPFLPGLGAQPPHLEPGASLAPKSGNGGEQRKPAWGVSTSVCSLHTLWPHRDTDVLQSDWGVPPI